MSSLVSDKLYFSNKRTISKPVAGFKKMPAAGSVKLSSINWVAGAASDLPLKINAKIRYRAKEAAAVLDKIGKNYVLRFAKPQFAPTPGQSAVFYVRGELIGGGIIK